MIVGSEPRGRLPRWSASLPFLLTLFGVSLPAAAQVVDPGLVIQTIDASLWDPPAPDTAGITYRPDTGELVTCDSEVDEMEVFEGVNVWTHSNTGVVSSTASTTDFESEEPTGIVWDPGGGRLWVSDDNRGRIFEIDLGSDGEFGTSDDAVTDLNRYEDAGCEDLEDVGYDPFENRLYVSSGASQEICRITPGLNGVFDGAPPSGDDVVSTFSVAAYGILDPEGIVYDPLWDTLVVADRSTRDLYELTPEGDYLRKIDVNFPGGTKPSGVTIAPGSTNPLLRNYWVTDRRVDNGGNPDENDGRVYEVVALPLGGNGSPVVDAGPPQNVSWPPDTVNLAGFVSDDGHPYPPSSVAALWSKLSGPGSVSFGDDESPETTATFSQPGSYVLQLEGDDSEAQSIDTVAIDLIALHTLNATAQPGGSVSVDPAAGPYPTGSSVTLTAIPASGRVFGGWTGDASGSANPLLLQMNSDKAVQAKFNGTGGGGFACGIGPELAEILPVLAWLHRRRRRRA